MRHLKTSRPTSTSSVFAAAQVGTILGTILAASPLTTAPARAADLDSGFPDMASQMPQLPQQTVSFGSGWYVRGDIAATELYGVNAVRGTGNEDVVALGRSSDVGYDLSLGGGYAFTNNIRGDIDVDFQQPVQSKTFNTRCISTRKSDCELIGKFDHYDALANIYYDFGTWSIVTPYIGAGAGVAFGNVRTNLLYDTIPYASYRGYHNFAWALMAGAAFDVYPHVKLDIGYRFLNNGDVDGVNVYSHEVRAGLRYMIDN